MVRASSVAPRAVNRRGGMTPVGSDGSDGGGVAGALGRGSRRLPVHLRELTGLADVAGRFAVALQAPAHGERLLLGDAWRLVDAAVAGGAADAAVQVRRVIEVHV